VGLHEWLRSPAFEQWLKGDSDTARQVIGAFGIMAEGARALGEKLAPWVESGGPQRLAERIANANKWIDEVPQKLKEALASEGIVPHAKYLTLEDIRSLTDAFEAAGSPAAAAQLNTLHEEVLALPSFRCEVQERWQKHGRWQVFSQVLAAFDTELYSVAIPAALAQAEGVVAHLFRLEGMKFPKYQEKVAELHADEFDLLGPLAKEVLAGLLVPFKHGTPAPKLNRHAVMHGGDSSYGTRENAIAAIMWADYIMCTADDYRAHPLPDFDGPAT